MPSCSCPLGGLSRELGGNLVFIPMFEGTELLLELQEITLQPLVEAVDAEGLLCYRELLFGQLYQARGELAGASRRGPQGNGKKSYRVEGSCSVRGQVLFEGCEDRGLGFRGFFVAFLEIGEGFLFDFLFEGTLLVGGLVRGGEGEQGFESVGVAFKGRDGGGGVSGEEPLVDVGPVFGQLGLLAGDGGGEYFGGRPDVAVVSHWGGGGRGGGEVGEQR